MPRLIGLTGRMGSGKDTAYEIMSGLSNRVKRDAFADRLKRSAAYALGYEGPDPVGFCNELKEHGVIDIQGLTFHPAEVPISGREYLQWYGTEAHRDVFGQDFWIRAVLPDVADHIWFGRKDLNPDDILVITDVRFQNEVEAIWQANGEVWEINADERLPAPRVTHMSEQKLKEVDCVIDNNRSPEDFARNIAEVFE